MAARRRGGGRLFREALDALSSGVLVVSRRGTVLHATPAAVQLCGRELVLRPLRAAGPAGASLWALAEGSLEGGASRAEIALRPGVVIEATCTPLLRPGGVPAVLLELRPARDGLDLPALAAGLAHEIRNPLAGIKGAADLLLAEAPHGPQAPLARLISTEVTRVDALATNLLELTRPPRLTLVPAELHEICEEALAALGPVLPASIRLVRRYDASLPKLPCDAAALLQVLRNLLKNAVEAMPTGGELTVETGVAAGRRVRREGRLRPLARLTVQDCGAGLSPDAKLFTPFATTKPRGTGLGLVVSRRLVEAHGGRLELHEREGAPGVIAELLLPL